MASKPGPNYWNTSTMQNNLFLRRLIVVSEDGQYAYDEPFHLGVNIIRGHNSSGKSTIIRFIFFVLGGCYSDFTPEALRCRSVIAEVEINGRYLILKRNLDKTADGMRVDRYAPMYIYFGSIDEYNADQRPHSVKFQKFPYKTSSERRSFSNVLFELMGMPEFKADSNITMHQILRLIYLDQESPLSSIFLFETFDKDLTRETVSNLLMGLYDKHLSIAKQDKESLEKEIEDVKRSIKVTEEILANPDTHSTLFLHNQIEKLNKEIAEITEYVKCLREGDLKLETLNLKLRTEYQRLQEEIPRQRKACDKLEADVLQLKNEIQDTCYFIDALKRKKDAIDHSISTRDYFDSHHLDFCPECLTRLDAPVEEGHCPLCKSPIDNSRGKTQATRIRLELEFQIRQAETVQKSNESELEEKRAKLRSMKLKLTSAQKQYDAAVNYVRSTQEERIDELIQTKGYKEGEIAQFNTLLEYADKYERLQKKYTVLSERLSETDRYIKAAEKKIDHDKEKINDYISENGLFLLNNDDVRQDEFVNASDFKIDYKQNQVYISNKRYKLSASSSFYLKMAARFALFFASLQVDSMLYPRFMFSDNMEDKGMEEKRAKNFQRIIMERLNQMPPVDYQLIYATSNIAEELDIPEYTVGDKYTPSNKSLKNV